MKSEEIKHLFSEFETAASEIEGVECWSAREMQILLGYSKWDNFEKVIDKAKIACTNAGEDIDNHFPDVGKMVIIGSGAEKLLSDIALTRYACYLVAQNGDPRKVEIAFAQNYFAVQTRRAEVIEQRILEYERIQVREKLSHTEKQLSGIIYDRGVDNQGFGIIRSKGDQALFRLTTSQLKSKMGVPEKRALADFLPTISIKAKDFAAEMTSLNIQNKDLHGQNPIEREHVENSSAVRSMLINRGIFPERLPASEDTDKVKRRLVSEERKVLNDSKKGKEKKTKK